MRWLARYRLHRPASWRPRLTFGPVPRATSPVRNGRACPASAQFAKSRKLSSNLRCSKQPLAPFRQSWLRAFIPTPCRNAQFEPPIGDTCDIG
jgi:hypothetical protein